MHAYVRVSGCRVLCRYPRGPEDVADPLALEVQVVVSHLMWVGAGNYTQQYVLLNTEPSFQVQAFFF